MSKPRYRLATDEPLKAGAPVTLSDASAHYLANVLRLKGGDRITLFNRTDGEWLADIAEIKKKAVLLQVAQQLRAPSPPLDFCVAFAPIKGGRLETIIEKATELGAGVLQPVITQRTIVDKVNMERAEATAREAAEQCERIDWPRIHEPQKLAKWLGDLPPDMLLVYGDETGEGEPVTALIQKEKPQRWCILAGPEGGFTPEELAMLRHLRNARPVSLGPRILRADTAVITLAAMTLSAWGDWQHRPRFHGGASA